MEWPLLVVVGIPSLLVRGGSVCNGGRDINYYSTRPPRERGLFQEKTRQDNREREKGDMKCVRCNVSFLLRAVWGLLPLPFSPYYAYGERLACWGSLFSSRLVPYPKWKQGGEEQTQPTSAGVQESYMHRGIEEGGSRVLLRNPHRRNGCMG